MVTRSGWLVVIGSAGTILLGRLFGLPELAVFGTTGLVLVLAAVVRVRFRSPELGVVRVIHPPRIPVGGRSRVELTITNRGRRRSPLLTLHDPVEGTIGARVALAPLPPAATQAASYRLPTDRRGLVGIGPLELQVTDAFGLARRSQVVEGTASLTVLPSIVPLSVRGSGSALDDPLAGVAHPVLGGSGNEDFSTLRPYVVGDDLRRIHWASTARAGDLLVRQDDPPWRGHVTVMLDAREERTDPARFEIAVSAAASLLHVAGRRGDRARLVISDGTDTGLVDARSAADTLLEHLALVQLHAGTALPETPVDGRMRTGALVLVTGSPTADDIARFAVHRARYAATRLVVIHPSAVGATGAEPALAVGPGIDLVVVDADRNLAAAWAASDRDRRASR